MGSSNSKVREASKEARENTKRAKAEGRGRDFGVPILSAKDRADFQGTGDRFNEEGQLVDKMGNVLNPQKHRDVARDTATGTFGRWSVANG